MDSLSGKSLESKNEMRKGLKRIAVLLCILLLSCIFLAGCSENVSTQSYMQADGDALITFLDTGQSNATLIQTSSGENVLIDTGDASSRNDLIEDLDELGVDTIDLLVITHWHLDHAGGAVQVIENFDVKEAWITDNLNSNKTTTKALEALDNYGVETVVPEVGDQLTIGDCVFTMVGPVEDYTDQNESSIVIRMTHGNNAFLFPGDMEDDATDTLVESGQDITCEVLLAPHHGSAYAVSDGFWRAVGSNLQIVVVECGVNNSYGHPHQEVLDYCSENGIDLYRTDEDGEIQILSTDSGVEVVYVEKG